jgi:hypothetical protein
MSLYGRVQARIVRITGLTLTIGLSVSLHGPAWLTGGHVGPVGSVIRFAVFAFAGAVITLMFSEIESTIGKAI